MPNTSGCCGSGFSGLSGWSSTSSGSDADIEFMLDVGEPNGLDVTVDQIAVGEILGRRAHHAVHHLPCVVEEPLVVRALRRAVGQHQRSLAGAPGTWLLAKAFIG